MNEKERLELRDAVREWARSPDPGFPKLAISPWEMNKNTVNDPELIFNPRSPQRPAFEKLCGDFVAALTAEPLPPGLQHPIASGPTREPISRRNIETLLANLLRMQRKGKRTMSLSLRRNDYSRTKLSAGYINNVKLASHPSRGLLILQEGFRDHVNPKNSRTARVKPKRRFRDLVDTLVVRDDAFASDPLDLIGLKRSVNVKTKGKGKKRKRKVWVPREEWEASLKPKRRKELDRLREQLEWWNTVIQEFEITYRRAEDDELHYLYPALYVRYTEDFDHGGRLYTGKGGHQGLSKLERKTLRINGKPTIELDFGGLHIRMLYHLVGREYPLSADPYAVVLETMGLDPDDVFTESPSIRDDLKEMLLALVNGKGSRKQAIARAYYRMFLSWKGESGEDRDIVKDECDARRERWDEIGLEPNKDGVKQLIKAFRKAHKPIREHFSTGCGLYLQNLDAKIARKVLERLMPRTGECTPVLPVHDSFICLKDFKRELSQAMKDSYREVMQHETKRKEMWRIPVKNG